MISAGQLRMLATAIGTAEINGSTSTGSRLLLVGLYIPGMPDLYMLGGFRTTGVRYSIRTGHAFTRCT